MKHIAERYGVDFRKPMVMTVVNVTPDSFYAASRTPDEEQIAARVRQAIAEGCSIIDIGGYSSRPGAEDVPLEEEWRRVKLGIVSVRQVCEDTPISVDTFRAEIAERAVALDERIIINDISAGELDLRMIPTVADAGVAYIAMNMRGTPQTMTQLTDYKDVTDDVVKWFRDKVEHLTACGVREENILLDPGFGFAKTLEQNYELLGRLEELCALGYPIVAGVSRKSMIYRVLDTTPDDSLAGTTALHWELLRQGAAVLRVHDTRAAVDTIKIFEKFKSLNNK